MVSVASGGTAERIAARTLFRVLRAGSGTPARYSSTLLGATLPFAAEPRAPGLAFFIATILQGRSLQFYLSAVSACAQLHLVQSAARPGLRHREHDERKRIPVRPERRPFVPRHGGAQNAHSKADDAAHEGVLHMPIGCEPRDDVAAQDAVDGAIARRKQEGSVETNHRRSPGRKNMDSVKHDVGHESDCDAHDHASEHCANAPAETARRIRIAHDGLSPFAVSEVPRAANNCSRLASV